jgi:CubicO group peptidase (beta-lactamase class C family)
MVAKLNSKAILAVICVAFLFVGAVFGNTVSGLQIGRYYTVEVDGVKYYVRADGTLSRNISDVALLRVSQISGVPAGGTPNVTASAQYPVEYADLSPEYRMMIDRINALVDDHFENRSYCDDNKTNWNVTGLSVGVIKNGKVFFFNRGYHESAQRNVAKRTKITENSVFEIGSTSKPITGALFSYLSRAVNPSTGVPYLNLDDPVNKYFRVAPYIDSEQNRIYPTLMQLARHRAGFPRSTPTNKGRAGYTINYLMADLENLTYTSRPGTDYLYSGFGTNVLGSILAYAYYGDAFPKNKVYEDVLQELFCKPLGLKSTTTAPWLNPEVYGRKAPAHRFDGRSISMTRGSPAFVAGGGINSTASDMILWLALVTGDFIPEGAAVFHEAAKAGISWNSGNSSVPYTALLPHESNIAKFCDVFKELFPIPENARQRYGICFSHGGAISGYSTSMRVCPRTNTAVVVLVNTASGRGSLSTAITGRALNAVYAPVTTPAPTTVSAPVITPTTPVTTPTEVQPAGVYQPTEIGTI